MSAPWQPNDLAVANAGKSPDSNSLRSQGAPPLKNRDWHSDTQLASNANMHSPVAHFVARTFFNKARQTHPYAPTDRESRQGNDAGQLGLINPVIPSSCRLSVPARDA